ncbi:1-(5-phosphoribosyl)-5-[(5-phosphoribosylamino)methylideneamino]imidazole-4-carboxamide isomerase [Prevotella sp. A2931]|uniref:1-(5-phosphoribosyl)-5-[(5-phosphoribosylamino)methylideneamino] imidazole-4-carboxamide isomerase n=1 Tax=Prevotella illustrans TaxID=2800387 RepID=A0ABS3M385_9BACT|nr:MULTISPECIES: 1-(5-phosphoribosyl)-5-[(5-phosphoribosylamino)methylideneamino]imidazole-4-carboxamide isomerase [Prevotella]MBO1362622.1 1-(5-phosphoribosyl)-5-[(5-phosphoribosylamino)methylideneamino]imidazole-4-carboxamide isomerase [Prevotella illustrans]PTL25203.1 1-(5-phosphoribosyl)-5-[(5-phosphoribosylamino)methylideneamino]imidazole-4-carboxamide isomerase [Prevotella sp. oral taxon 820]
MKMELIPAIDLINGQCVRLTKGDYNRKKVYHADPVAMAKQFEALGFKRLHVVDLDGARSRHIVNDSILKQIVQTTHLQVDFGGGIQTHRDIEKAFDAGATMVTVSSIAVMNPELTFEWIKKYGADRLILGADVRDGKISINGWQDNSEMELFAFLNQFVNKGVRNVLCTDISKDGTLQGPTITLYRQIMKVYPNLHLIASGGIADNEDLEELEQAGIPAAVFGKAFYEGKIDIQRLGL